MVLDRGSFGNQPKVNVLLSVYRGNSYLAKQLESIRWQVAVDVSLVYHLDEEDAIAEELILRAFPDARRISARPGQGLPTAYFKLLQGADMQADFWAFSDQDDVWAPDKLSSAVEDLSEYANSPALWACAVAPFSEEPTMKRLPAKILPRIGERTLGNALVKTLAPACSMVWNSRLHTWVLNRPPSGGVLMHDAWLCLVASSLGAFIVHESPMVAYRIHSGNSVGLDSRTFTRIGRFLDRMSDDARPTVSSQAQAFLSSFGDLLDQEQLDLVECVAKPRLLSLARMSIQGRIGRGNFIEDIFFFLSLTAHKWFGTPRRAPDRH